MEAVLNPHKALAADQLRTTSDPAVWPFSTTADLEPLDEVLGQARAVEAIRFGIAMRRSGFNVFAFGPPGTGKRTTVHHYVGLEAARRPAPDAWCYVFNFEDPRRPVALRLPAGRAADLRRDVNAVIEELLVTLPAAFDADVYAARRDAVAARFETQAQANFDLVAERAAERGLALLRGPEGAGLVPLTNGEVMKPDAYAALPPDRQVALRSAVEGLNPDLESAVRAARVLDREARAAVSTLDREIALAEVAVRLDELRERYTGLPAVADYLDRLQADILDHLDDFRRSDEPDPSGGEGFSLVHPDAAVAARWRRQNDNRFRRYDVNVLLDAPAATGAPVVHEVHPTLGNLVGRVEQRPEFGTLVTDFSLIKPGALHRANGGYLLLDAAEVLKQPHSWDALKRALRHGEIRIEAQVDDASPFGSVSLVPEPIPLDCKVVLLGDDDIYFHLAELDTDTAELFKVPAEFADTMPRNPESELRFARFLAAVCQREELLPASAAAVAALVEFASRRAEDALRLSTCFLEIADVLREADFWSAGRESALVDAADVEQALEARERRYDLAREEILEAFDRDVVLMHTDGEAVGRMNGLTVMSRGPFDFGVPARISARVRLGGGEVLDIEREVELGGPVHSKGVLVLAGCLAGRYLPDDNLAMSASLTFEQSYVEIEGDSASSAELYALLSALSGIPLSQSLAVTGSVNQDGEIQAVAGVNEKIEGFFDLCARRGLTGRQGALIPVSNVQHLMLRSDVVEAAREGRFHVYAIRTIDEGLSLLTGRPAGERGPEGEYPEGSVNRAVEDRLRALAEKRREGRGDDGDGDEPEGEAGAGGGS